MDSRQPSRRRHRSRKPNRKPLYIGIAAAIIVLGGIVAVWLYSSRGTSDTAAPVRSDLGPYTVVVAGIDSLTDGAGGSDWRRYFKQAMIPELGDGGPGWASFSERGAEDHGAEFSSPGFRSFALGSPEGSMSLDGEGITTANGGSLTWSEPGEWDKARVFYRGGSDGSLTCSGGGEPQGGAIAWIDVSGPGPLRCTATGPVTAYGALFLSGDSGLVMVNMARSGRKLADAATQSYRAQWFAALLPDVFILNAGTNDWRDDTPQSHSDNLRRMIDDALAGSPDMRAFLVQHNAFGGTQDARAAEKHMAKNWQKKRLAEEIGGEVIDVEDALGSYSSARSRGLIMDTVHPSDAGNRILGPFFADAVFGDDGQD